MNLKGISSLLVVLATVGFTEAARKDPGKRVLCNKGKVINNGDYHCDDHIRLNFETREANYTSKSKAFKESELTLAAQSIMKAAEAEHEGTFSNIKASLDKGWSRLAEVTFRFTPQVKSYPVEKNNLLVKDLDMKTDLKGVVVKLTAEHLAKLNAEEPNSAGYAAAEADVKRDIESKMVNFFQNHNTGIQGIDWVHATDLSTQSKTFRMTVVIQAKYTAESREKVLTALNGLRNEEPGSSRKRRSAPPTMAQIAKNLRKMHRRNNKRNTK